MMSSTWIDRRNGTRLGLAVAVAVVLGLIWGPPAGAIDEQDGSGYEQLLEEHAEYQAEIGAAEAAIAADEEAERNLLAYSDSLEAHPDLAKHEEALAEAMEEDAILASRHAAFEEAAAADPEAAEQMVAFDNLLAENPDLAEHLEDVEHAAAASDGFLEQHGDAIAQLEADGESAEEFYALEGGPTYVGADPVIIAYVDYLVAHPRLYRAWWRTYHYLRANPLVAHGVYAHWRWYNPRPRLWSAWWNYRLRVATHRPLHRVFWERRVYLGQRPWLARPFYNHRWFIAGRPALRPHLRFLRRHPRIARGIVHHRRWAVHHPHMVRPPKAKPIRVVKPVPPPKPRPIRRR
ncbi:MAG: hypothetical protein KAY32_08290 [Candidatus Eisenbacteria sp.]|nr:hypothetical protein [Candidatus Eisenbacteria bacterium]